MNESTSTEPKLAADTPIDYTRLESKGFVPAGSYTCYVKEHKQTPASTGTLQDVLEMEILAPDKKVHGGVTYNVAGVGFRLSFYHTPKSMARNLEVFRKLGVPGIGTHPTTADLQAALAAHFKQATFDIALASRERRMKEQMTSEDVAAGKKSWQLADAKDEFGKPIVLGWELDPDIGAIRAGSYRRLENRPF